MTFLTIVLSPTMGAHDVGRVMGLTVPRSAEGTWRVLAGSVLREKASQAMCALDPSLSCFDVDRRAIDSSVILKRPKKLIKTFAGEPGLPLKNLGARGGQLLTQAFHITFVSP